MLHCIYSLLINLSFDFFRPLGCVKASGLENRKQVHIFNIDLLAIYRSARAFTLSQRAKKIKTQVISAALLLASMPNALLAATESTSPTPPMLIPEEFNAPLNESPDRFVSEFLNMLAMLGLVLLVLLTVTWFLKKVLNSRLQQVDASSSLKILERRPISPKSTLLLVEVAGQGMALAESTNGITFLSHVPLEDAEDGMSEPPTAPKPAKGNFSSFLDAPK